MSKNAKTLNKTRETTWKILLRRLGETAVALFGMATLWLIAYVVVGNELLVPALSDCLNQLGGLLIDGEFWMGFLHTLGRVFLAFTLSFVSAAFFAVIAYTVPWFGRILSPMVSALRSLPVLAVLLIILVISGAGVAPVIVAFLSLSPMLYAGFLAALCQVDKDLIKMSRVYNVPLKRRILSLYLPSAAPYAMRESAAALAFSLKLVVSAEVLASTYKSLGGLMQEARLFLEMPTLFALVSITFFVGLILETAGNILAEFVERRVK